MTYSYWDGEDVPFETLLGKTITKIVRKDEEIKFFIADNHYFLMHHYQNCCESVYIEDVNGDLDDLIDSPILHADESSNSTTDEWGGVMEWTFYKLATVKGWVDIRWSGSSNGYYSTSVSLVEFDGDKIAKKRGH